MKISAAVTATLLIILRLNRRKKAYWPSTAAKTAAIATPQLRTRGVVTAAVLIVTPPGDNLPVAVTGTTPVTNTAPTPPVVVAVAPISNKKSMMATTPPTGLK